MNHSTSYGTPERKTATRRFCSTPISPGYPPDDEVGYEEDIHSFISSLDEFVEHCNTFLASPSPAHVTPRSSTSYGQPVEEGDPLPPQQCVQGGEEDEEEDTYCEYRDIHTHSERGGPCRSAGVLRDGQRGNPNGERENQCLRIVELQQASGGPPLEGLYFGPNPTDTEQVPLENIAVEAQNRCFCHNPADCQGGPQCFVPHIECLDVDSTLSARCAQRPEPEVQHGYCTKNIRSSRRLDFCTFGDYDEVPGEKPDLYLETYNAYCAMKDRPPTSGGHLYHHSSASEQHSASFDASVDMEGDPPERGTAEDDWQQYSNSKYDAICQIEDLFGPHEYPEESDLYPRLFPDSRCSGLDTVVNEQKENNSNSTTYFYSAAACSSSSCHKPLNLSKELNRPKTEASNRDVPKAANQHLASKEPSTEHPVVAGSSAASVQRAQFSQASDTTLPTKGEGDSFDASAIMEDAFTRENCLDKCKWKQCSNCDPSCKMDDAFAPNEHPEGSEKQKSEAYSQPFPSSRCSMQDTVAAGQNEKKLEPNFYCSAAGSAIFCDKSPYSCKELNGPETEAFNRDVSKASNQPLASNEASTESTVMSASSAASTQCKQSTPNRDTTLSPQDKSAKLRLHQAVDNDSSACRAGTVQSGLATRGCSPVFFTDITHAVPAPRMTDSKPPCRSPAVGYNSAARSNGAGQPQDPVSLFEYADEIDETLIACSTPSEDEVEFDEANTDIYEDLDIKVCAASPPPSTPECKLVPASSMPHAHSDDVTEGSELLDTTLVASADAATKHACKSNASLSSPSSVKPADVLDIHLCVEDDGTFASEVQSPSLVTKLTTSTVIGGRYSPVVHAKSIPSTRTSESQCSAVLLEDPPRTSATLATTSTPRTNCNSTRCPVSSAAPSPRHSRTDLPAQGLPKSVDHSPDFLQATVVKNLKTQNSVKLAAHSKVDVTNFLDEYEGGSSPGGCQSGPEVLAIDLEEGEVLSSPTNSPRANCNSKRAPVPSAAPSLRHSGTGSPAQRSLKSVDQLPNLLRATLVKNLKTQNSVKLAAHSNVHVTNFLDEYEGGSSPGSSQSDPEVLVIDLEEGEVLSSPTNCLSEGEIGDSSGSKDLRARINEINAVKGLPECQFEEVSRGKNIKDGYSPLGCSTTIDALCLEAREPATSSQALEIKIRDPFLSEDPAENLDNDNPAWEALRQLTTDEERYQHVHRIWRSSQIPDPHQELTTFHYRRRVAGLRSRVDTPAMKRGKRRASHEPSPSEGVGPIKRQRFDTDIFDLKLKELERKKAKDFTEAKDNLKRNLDRLHRDIKRNEERQGTYHTHQRHYHHNEGWSQRHHHRAETAPSDYHYWRMQERQIREEFVANAQCINEKFSVKERQLLTARDEVHRFDAFYVGLHQDFDPRLLSESQLKQQLEAEKALGLFRLYYSPAQH